MAITVVQSTFQNVLGSPITVTLTGVVSGDWLVCMIGTDNHFTPSVSTTAGTTNAWTQVTSLNGTSCLASIAYTQATSSGTITVTISATSSNISAGMLEASGVHIVDPATPVTNTATATSIATNNLTPAGANELFVASAASASGVYSVTSPPSSPWTGVCTGTSQRGAGAYQVASDSAAHGGTFTLGFSAAASTILVAFEPTLATGGMFNVL